MFLSRRTRLAPPPASCSAGSLTVSRKAKKSGPGSSRRKGPPPSQATRHRLGQHPGSQSHRIQGDCGRGRGLFPGRRVGDSSGFLGAQKWKVEEGLRNSAFCSRCCQGAGRRGGVLRPRGGQCGRWAADEKHMTGYQGTEWDQGACEAGERGRGTAGQDTTGCPPALLSVLTATHEPRLLVPLLPGACPVTPGKSAGPSEPRVFFSKM